MQWILDIIQNRVKSWKTTLTAIIAGVVFLLHQFGIDIPAEVQTSLALVLIFFIGLFAKDAAVKGTAENNFK